MHAPISRSFVKPCPGTPQRYRLGRLAMNAVVAGQGRPIVFIHGLGWDYSLWGGAMTRLSDRYRTIAGDTRGHGDSDKPAGPYSVQDFADDWAELIRTLADEPALVVGFSLGGMIAQVLALDHPDLVGALMLVNTSCRSPAIGSAHLRERVAAGEREGPAAAAMLAARSVFSQAWRDTHPAELAEFVEWRVGHDQQALGASMRAASNFDVTDRIGSLAIPVLVVTARDDRIMPAADQDVLAATIPGAGHATIADTGHMLQIEQSEAFEDLLETFVQSHWPEVPAGRTVSETDKKDRMERITVSPTKDASR